jgi:hypothetical protein
VSPCNSRYACDRGVLALLMGPTCFTNTRIMFTALGIVAVSSVPDL